METFLIIIGILFIVYFFVKAVKADEKKKDTLSDYDRQVLNSYSKPKPVDSDNDKIVKLTNKMIDFGVDGFVSLEMTEFEKEDIVAKTLESFRVDLPVEQLSSNMYKLALKAYQKQIATYTEDRHLNDEIKKRYRKFLSITDKSDFEQYGYDDLLKFSARYKLFLGGGSSEDTDGDDVGDFLLFDVAGIMYRPKKIIKVASKLYRGASLHLECEPDNQYDKNAVKVLYDGEMIGYVEKEMSEQVSEIINTGAYMSCEVFMCDTDYEYDISDSGREIERIRYVDMNATVFYDKSLLQA